MTTNARIYKRTLAKFIDIVIINIVAFIIRITVSIPLDNFLHENPKYIYNIPSVIQWILLMLNFFGFIIAFLIYELICFKYFQKTIGKLVFNLKFEFNNQKLIYLKFLLHILLFHLLIKDYDRLPLWMFTIPFFLIQIYLYKKQTLYDLLIGIKVVEEKDKSLNPITKYFNIIKH